MFSTAQTKNRSKAWDAIGQGRMPRRVGCWPVLSEKFMDEIVFTCCPKFITPLSPSLYFYLYNPFAYGTPTNFCTWQKPAVAEAAIGICEPPFGLVEDKNHPSEQTDQLDLFPAHPHPHLHPSSYLSPAITYAKMGPCTVARFIAISLGSVYNACFANFYELANGQSLRP